MKAGAAKHFYLLLLCLSISGCISDTSDTLKNQNDGNKIAETSSTPSSPKVVKKPSSNIANHSIINYKNVDVNLMADLVHQEINKVRKANNLPQLSKNPVLVNAATDQTNYQVSIGDISHQQKQSTKKSPGDRFQLYGEGIGIIAENVIF